MPRAPGLAPSAELPIPARKAGLETGEPITFGILTTYTDEQAILRSRKDEHNKGREAAAACLEALHTIAAIAR